MTLFSWAKPGHRLVQETPSVPCSISLGFSGSLPNARPNAASTFRAWSRSKRSTKATVPAFEQPNLQISQKPADGEPEVVAHHDDALHPPAVALPQGLHKFRVLLLLLGVQPLLELVEDDQHFLAGWNALAPAQRRQRLFQPRLAGRPDSVSADRSADEFPSPPPWPRHKRRSRARTGEAASPPSPATTCRNRKARRSGPP